MLNGIASEYLHMMALGRMGESERERREGGREGGRREGGQREGGREDRGRGGGGERSKVCM